MDINFNLYTALIFIAATTSFLLALVAWRHRHNRLVNTVFALLMVSIGFWAAFNFLEHLTVSFAIKIFASNLVYIGIVSTVALWLIFSLVYTGRSHLLTRRNLLLLSIEPVLLLLLLWTNPWHHLIRTAVGLDNSGAFPVLMIEYNSGFWLHTIYSYLLLLAGTVLLIQHVLHAPDVYRKQVVALLISLAVPWLLNVLYLSGITHYGLTATGFTVTGLVIAWGLLRLRFLDIVPTARTAVFASLHDVVIVLDDQNRIVDLNPAAEQLIGGSQVEAIGQRLEALFPYQPELAAGYSDLPEIHTELTFTANNAPEYYDLRISPIYNRQHHLVARVVVMRDITRRKRAEKAEREERQLAEALRDIAVALTSTLDPSEIFSRILTNIDRVLPHDSANIMLNNAGVAAVVDVHGFRDSRDKPVLFQQQYIVAEIETLRRMAATRQPVVIPDVHNFPAWYVNEKRQWIRSFIGVPILQDDEVIGFINLDSKIPGTFQPEHGRRLQAFAEQVAVALKNARLYQALEERNEELDAYAYTIAHDLNSPLALIQGYAGLTAQLELPAAAYPYLDKITDTTNRMAEMIEQLLLLAKLKDVETTAVSVELYPLLLAVKARFADQIAQRQIQLDIQQEWPPVLGQPAWIEEIVANLLGNALKYIGHENKSPCIKIYGGDITHCGTLAGSETRSAVGRPGSAQVYPTTEHCFGQAHLAQAVRQEDKREQVLIVVEDNGLGISAKNQEDLFAMFTRYHKEEAPGTGLGLPIVARIVTKLGGSVWVESVVGAGSAFYFTLPAA